MIGEKKCLRIKVVVEDKGEIMDFQNKCFDSTLVMEMGVGNVGEVDSSIVVIMFILVDNSSW